MKIREALSHPENAFRFRNISCGIMSCFASFPILQNHPIFPIRQFFYHVPFFPSCWAATLSVTFTESCVNIPAKDFMKIREALSPQ